MTVLIKNATIITQDKHRRIIPSGTLTIDNGRITSIDKKFLRGFPGKVLNASDYVLVPGFVNAHVHLGESIFTPFLQRNLNLGRYLKFTNALIKKSPIIEKHRSTIADYSMMLLLQGGVTSICGGRTHLTGEKWGIKNLSGYMLMKSPKFKKYYDGKSFKNEYRSIRQSRFSKPAIFIHSLNFIDKQKLNEIKELLETYHDLRVIVHLSETYRGEQGVRKTFKETSTRVLDLYGLLGPRSILVHCNWLTNNDLSLIKRRRAFIVHCPTSNFSVDDNTFNIEQGVARKIPICLGSDGLATSGSLDMLSEGRFAYLYHNRFSKNVISPQAILDMMTITPARALGMEEDIGSIEPGKCADIIFISKKMLSGTGKNILRDIVFRGNPLMISRIMIDGIIRSGYGISDHHQQRSQKITDNFLKLEQRIKKG